MNTETTTTKPRTNGANGPVTIAELAMRPAMTLSRKQFRAVGEFAMAAQRLAELRQLREHHIAEAARMEVEIEGAEKGLLELGNQVFGE